VGRRYAPELIEDLEPLRPRADPESSSMLPAAPMLTKLALQNPAQNADLSGRMRGSLVIETTTVGNASGVSGKSDVTR
jgi:hypothetical protein